MQSKKNKFRFAGKPAKLVIICALACAWFCNGCSGSQKPAANVPDDCQKWLTSYFDALKLKDTAKIQALCSVVSARDIAMLPAGSPEMVRTSKKQSTATILQKIDQDLGNFKSYTVHYCNETSVAKDTVSANAVGEGRHIEIICETKYSKRTAKESFNLYKGPQDADFIVEAHSFTRSAF